MKRAALVVVFAALYFAGGVFAEGVFVGGDTVNTFRVFGALISELADIWNESKKDANQEESREWYRSLGPDEMGSMQPEPQKDPITIKEIIQLKAIPTRVRPGESFVLDAVFGPDAKNLGKDVLASRNARQGGMPYMFTLKRVGERHYQETISFKDTDSGAFDYAVAVIDARSKAAYASNKVTVYVAPDVEKQQIVSLRFSPDMVITYPNQKTRPGLWGNTRNSKRYELSEPGMGTVYSIEDESIATVTDDGQIEGHSQGKTILHAQYQSLSAYAEVFVGKPSPDFPKSVEPSMEDRPAIPAIISPVDGTVVERETKVFFEVSSFDVSKGHQYWGSDWVVVDERGLDRAHLTNESEKATWVPPLSGKYRWRMRHAYKGSPFRPDDSYYTPWTTLIVVPHSSDVKK
ncbi:hypothetical protein FACS1894187_13870 [Synergistales bacterium]|nr:hypothetical protein FACS1894187_13870 [Synergistales bacterium]